MSSLWRAVGVALLTLFLGIVLRELGFKGSRFISVVCAVGILALCTSGIELIADKLIRFGGGTVSDSAQMVMKMMGIGYVSGICADVCSELGEGLLANAITLLGKIEILMMSAPVALEIIERGAELIG